MNEEIKRTHLYHAEARALDADLQLPLTQETGSQAFVKLSEQGGYLALHSERYRLGGVLSYSSAYTQVAGTHDVKPGHGWTTLATSVVEHLNVLDIVTADRVVAQVATEHPLVGYVPSVTFLGTRFENLRIAGEKVNPVMNLGLLATPAGHFPDTPFTEDRNFISKAIEQNKRMLGTQGAPDWLAARYGWINSEEARRKKGYVLCSLVEQVEGVKHASNYGHVVNVPGFGNVFLGELSVSQGVFRLTMIRMEMGCAGDGNLSVGTSNSNGVGMP